MKKQVFYFIVLCSLHQVAHSQQQPAQLDSMLKVLAGEKEDSNKVKTLSRISQYYYNVNPQKCFPYANQALALAEKIQWKKGISNLHNNLGLYICDTGNNMLGRKHYEISYQLNLELGAKNNQVNNLNNIGRSYMVESDYTKAADNFFKALPIAEALKDPDLISLVASNLANCFETQKDYAKATQFAVMEMEHGKLANNTRRITHALIALGVINAALKDTMAAIDYAEKALKIAQETNNKLDETNALINFSSYSYPNYKKQIELLLRATNIMDNISPGSDLTLVSYADLGEAYLIAADHSSGAEKKTYIKKAASCLSLARSIAEKNNSRTYLGDLNKIFVHLEEHKGNYKTALDYYKKLTATNDSLFSQEKKNEIAGIEGKYNIAVKDNEIAINKLLLANQRKIQWALMAGLALLLVIGGLLYWQSRSRKKTNTTLIMLNNQLDEANKVKARFFGILSHDLRSPIINLMHFLHLQKENPGLLSQEQQDYHRKNISQSAENVLNTMEAMLLWSKEQMESFRPSIREVQVSFLFDYLQKFFAQTDNINFRFTADPGLVVSADENYLKTIMQNLTSNAVRALYNIPAATITWQAVKDGEQVLLSITDNGPGIEKEQVKTLFNEDIANNGKTGFGLHLIRDLAKAIKYNINVQSAPGSGTTFILSRGLV